MNTYLTDEGSIELSVIHYSQVITRVVIFGKGEKVRYSRRQVLPLLRGGKCLEKIFDCLFLWQVSILIFLFT
jgi:hypothetical protein